MTKEAREAKGQVPEHYRKKAAVESAKEGGRGN
jgi:hypothetical protein